MKTIFSRLAAAALLGISASAAITVPAFADDVKITVVGVGAVKPDAVMRDPVTTMSLETSLSG